MLRVASSRQSGRGVALVGVLTAGSMIHIAAPMLVTVAKARFRIPANIAVICIIRNTAKVMPINKAENLALSFTSSLNPIRRMPPYFMIPHFSQRPRTLLLTDVDIHQLAWIDRRILLFEPEDHRQHPQIHLFLPLIGQFDL